MLERLPLRSTPSRNSSGGGSVEADNSPQSLKRSGSNGSTNALLSSNGGAGPARTVARNQMRNNKMVVMVCTNIANLFCHSVYSVLASFFPQEAKVKGMSEEFVGLVFAIFAAVIFVASPFAARLMNRHGKGWVYISGICIVSISSILFAFASGARAHALPVRIAAAAELMPPTSSCQLRVCATPMLITSR